MRITIPIKLTVGFLLIILLIFGLGLYSIKVSEEALHKAVGKGSVFLASEMMTKIDKEIYQKVELFRFYSEDTLLQKTLSESNKIPNIQNYPELSNSLKERFIEFGERRYGQKIFDEALVTNKYGAVVAQTGKISKYYQADEEWWQKAKENGFYVGEVEFDKGSGVMGIPIAVRIETAKENFMGVLKIIVPFMTIVRPIEFAAQKYETTEVKLITKDGKLLYSTKLFRPMEDVSNKPFFKEIKSGSGFFVVMEGGRKRLFSYTQARGYRDFEGKAQIFIVEHDVREVLQPISTLQKMLFAGFFVVILIGIIVGYVISVSVEKPIKRLIRGIEIIGKGNLSHKIEISRDEIGEVSTAFNKMANTLSEYHNHLEEMVEERTKKLKEADWKLVQSEKLATVVQIASDAAHEIRNPLAVIKTGLYGLNLMLPAGRDDVQKMLQSMDNAVDRAASYLDDLLNISRSPALNLMPIKVNEVIEETLREMPILADIQIDKDFEDFLPPIEADPERLKQVFLNLIKNGVEAMTEVKSKKLKVKIEREGEFVKISISDTGKGIAEKDLLHIFDPFFTTKKGKGTGLGMCICQRIIEAHKGEMELTSQHGQGTTVVIKIRRLNG